MTDWTARRNDSESGSLRKDGRMTDWTTARVTPEKLAELRRLLDANEVPWSAHRPSPNYARYEIRDDRGYDLAYTVEDALGGNAEIIVAAVNALPALLDAAAELAAAREADA